MSPSKWILCVCLLTFFLNSATSEVKKVKPGEDVLLQCQGTRDAAILLLNWIRRDFKSEDIVFFFREDLTYENYQHLSFHGRVKLRDRQMKDRDISVILKNVKITDTATYECYVGYGDSSKLISSIYLKVEDSGGEAEHILKERMKDGENKGDRVEVAVAVSVAVMHVAVIASVILRTVIKNSCHPPAEQTVVLQQV